VQVTRGFRIDRVARDCYNACMTRNYYTAAELAQLLDVSPQTVRGWVRSGTAPDSYKVGRETRFPVETAHAWCRERGIPIPDGGRPGA